jgi:VanZ family protein
MDGGAAIDPIDRSARQAQRAWSLVALWSALILLASSERFSALHTGSWLAWIAQLAFDGVATDDLDMVHAMLRKTAHFVEYAILGLLAHRAAALSWPRRQAVLRLAACLFLAAACAGCDEGHQVFLAHRTGSGWDVLLDLSGALFGAVLHGFSRSGSPARLDPRRRVCGAARSS